MRKYILATLLILLITNIALGEEKLTHLGNFVGVRSTDTGHCYGTSISLWELKNNQLVGLLDVHAGLCGDPPCSIIQGSIKNNTVSFKTNVPIYDKLYSFSGKISNNELFGQLNNEKTLFKSDSYKSLYKNIKSWCSAWSQISRCSGVKEYCQ